MSDRVTFRMSVNVWSLLGLDDPALVASMCPSLKLKYICTPTTDWYETTKEDARIILDDMRERSRDGDGGFEHSKSERQALAKAAKHLASILEG